MCLFCMKIYNNSVVWKNDKVAIIKDGFPVTDGHHMIVPVRCVPNFFHLSPNEHSAVIDAIHLLSESLSIEDPDVDGYNIGWNVGGSGGATIEHAHCHLIPRRTGDCENPIGGVRNVIPEMGDYTDGI